MLGRASKSTSIDRMAVCEARTMKGVIWGHMEAVWWM